MTCNHRMLLIVLVLAASSPAVRRTYADDSNDGLVQMALELLSDQDNDIRALGLEQVRTAAPGVEATRKFAAALPKLTPAAQVALLSALADRKDPAARPAVLDILAKSSDEALQVAAVEALGSLGGPADVTTLVKLLAEKSKPQSTAAKSALTRLPGEVAPTAIAAELKHTPPGVSIAIIQILTARRAHAAVPDLLVAATSDDAAVRRAAMVALGELGGAENLPGIIQGVLKAKTGPERDAAERVIAEVCHRIPQGEQQAAVLLEATAKLPAEIRTALLPTLGRVGGPLALTEIEAAVADADPQRHELGVRALSNWPDASIAAVLKELATTDAHPEHRALALRALIRIAPLPDARPEEQRLALLKQVMAMCATDDQRQQVLQRASAIRTLESLRFVAHYLDQPAFAQAACETVVELAHHRGLREPNKAEFDKALDKVLAIGKDATIRQRASRYKKGQTWVRPKPQ